EAVLQVQAWRTPEQVEWAKTIQEDNLFKHSKIIGTWFLLYDLPIMTAIFKDVGEDLRAIEAAAKKLYLRPRPSVADANVKPCVTVPASTSYPSGGAMQAFVWAEILADLFPD